MALYEINTDNLTKISQTTFDQAGLRERDDLQRLLKKKIGIIAPDTLHRFWQELLRRGEGATALHTQMTPGDRSYIGANAGAKGLRYYYCASKTGSRVEIYIDRADADTNKVIFDQLFSHKEEIETAFGNSLFWQRLDTKRACRISYDLPLGVYKDVESDWETIQTALIETMVKFERAFSPFIT